jgi:uncharacterized Tic20 family protein
MDKNRANTIGMLCHLTSLLGFIIPLGNIFAPLLFWIFYRKKSSFINYHSKESLNFQISFTVWFLILPVIYFFLAFDIIVLFVGVLMECFLLIFYFMQIINISVNAKRGEYSKYPLTVRFIRQYNNEDHITSQCT